MSVASDPELMKCEVKIIAAVFTDGSSEGDDQALSSMQARRDGIASGVRYWMAKLNPQSGEMPEPEAILSDAESRSHTDRQKWQTTAGLTDEVMFSAADNYWMGTSQVDSWVAGNLKVEVLARTIGAWQKKIDRDIAMKKLAAAFPLPDGIAPPDPQSAP
jgi:hypothetical protein